MKRIEISRNREQLTGSAAPIDGGGERRRVGLGEGYSQW